MARHLDVHGPQSRVRAARAAQPGVELLILLLFVAMAALWIVGVANPSLLPIEPPR